MNSAYTYSELSIFHSIPKVIKKVMCKSLGADIAKTVDLSSSEGIPKGIFHTI